MIETSSLAHLSLYVADLDRSVKFYQGVFGLELLREHRGTIRGDPISLSTPGKADILTLIHAKGAAVESGGMSHFAFILQGDPDQGATVSESSNRALFRHLGGSIPRDRDSMAERSLFELSGDFVSGLQLFRFRHPDAKSCLPG